MATQIPGPNELPIREWIQNTHPGFPGPNLDAIPTEYDHGAASIRSENRQDRMMQNPLEALELDDLKRHVKHLFEEHFQGKQSVTERELLIGAKLARSSKLLFDSHLRLNIRLVANALYIDYANHERDPNSDPDHTEPVSDTSSTETVNRVLHPHDWKALDIQKSKKFWKEPKSLLVTLGVCCLAPWVQGWNQAANGNLGWPGDFGVSPKIQRSGADIWEFGTVNAVLWFAAMIGPLMIDPICNATWCGGRRGSVFIAACCSLAGSIGASRCSSWRHLLAWRILLGIGIGAKASIIPIWESEILPPAKRGRVLVSWQTFVAIGLLTGNGANYFFRKPDQWRSQILSGAIPALILIILVYIGCESPRWLIVQERYIAAFDTLVQLRKERLLAAEEFCYTYFQIQTERALARKRSEADFGTYQPPIRYTERLRRLITLGRNRNAMIATIIVMLTQHLSGINIFAFLGTNFYQAADLDKNMKEDERNSNNYRLSLGFAACTVLSSAVAYFLVEPLPVDTSLEDLYPSVPNTQKDFSMKKGKNRRQKLLELQRLLRGRRRLLLVSLGSGTIMLACLTGLMTIPPENPSKAGAVAAFVFFLAFCYSPGVGAVPFLYSAEIWPNEARDLGMSVGVFVNFFGLLTLVVPQALAWSRVKLFGIFTALSVFGFILVYFFVPCTNEAVSLEEMSAIFDNSLFKHARSRLIPSKLFEKNKGASAPLYRGPYDFPQPPVVQRAYSAPLPGPHPFYYQNQAQYGGMYGHQPQPMSYQVPILYHSTHEAKRFIAFLINYPGKARGPRPAHTPRNFSCKINLLMYEAEAVPSRDDFTLAIICAIGTEGEAVEKLFDRKWKPAELGRNPKDFNTYTIGRIAKAFVVVVWLAEYGKRKAATAAAHLKFSFHNIEHALIVGICGGVPRPSGLQEIVLGDVVISTEVQEYDQGKQYPQGYKTAGVMRPRKDMAAFYQQIEG
ncbi:hypothetical protein N0V90_003517 [Kalmusia sp. IMI 367209]|nr:hypothetical protein N0V90_003517 [Kalmusia sp. IMI 367209]